MKDPLNSSMGAQTEDALGLVVDQVDMARVGPGEKPLHDEGTPGNRPPRGADDRNGFGVEKNVQLVIADTAFFLSHVSSARRQKGLDGMPRWARYLTHPVFASR